MSRAALFESSAQAAAKPKADRFMRIIAVMCRSIPASALVVPSPSDLDVSGVPELEPLWQAVMAYINMAYIGMAHMFITYIAMAYIVMAYIVMAYVVMA